VKERKGDPRPEEKQISQDETARNLLFHQGTSLEMTLGRPEERE